LGGLGLDHLRSKRDIELIESQSHKIYNRKWIPILILLGLCCFLYFFNLGRWDLWVPDEPKYAQVAKEMVDRGDWILMHFNGAVYGDKPPLFFWLIALSSFLWKGFSSFSVRFPSAVFGTLTVLLTFLMGKRLYSSRAGFFSGLILATSAHFIYLSTRANIDATLTFFTTASLFCFFLWYGYRTEKQLNENRQVERLSIYGFYVSMAFATLAKGPIGFILPLLVSFIFLLTQGDYKQIKRMKLLPGIPLLVAIVLAWYVPAVLSGGKAYVEENLFRHTTEAYVKGWTHPRPIYYYFYTFPAAFLPWIFFLPGAIAQGLSKSMVGKRKGFFFLLVWFAVIFTFFTLSKSKRDLYLLPVFPAVSLMVGKFWDDFISNPLDQHWRRWIIFPLFGIAGFGLIAGAVIPYVASTKFPSYLPYVLPVAVMLAGSCIALLIFSGLKNYTAVLIVLIGMMVGGSFYASRVIFPVVNSHVSARLMSEDIKSRIQPGDKLATYRGIGVDPYNYYTGIVPIPMIHTEEALLDFVRSSERVFCLLRFRDFSECFNKEGRPKVVLIVRRRVRRDDVVLISNR
jgi:4-amino-4-deoxy-L-arabinose transferase-like glycosyltransferase